MNVLLMYQPSAEHAQALRHVAPRAAFESAESEQSAAALIRDADAVLGNRYFLESLPHARQLRWMQSNSAGVDLILSAGPAALDDIVLTCARGVYDDEVADHAVALVLALTRRLHHARDAQRERRWERPRLETLRGRHALVIGWGGIGKGIAERLRAFGVEVEGVRRRIAETQIVDGFPVHSPLGWRARLPWADILVAALPLTNETRGLVGAAELSALRPGALVVNVGRAQTVEEGAVLAALRDGRLGGAALDVLDDEPPPPEHAAWAESNLLLTPHVARSPEQPPFRWEPLFVENLRRFAAGEPLLNVVDVDAGY